MRTRHSIGSIIPTLEAVVLGVLDRTTAPMALREIHRLAGEGSLSGIRKALQRLVGSGVVVIQGEPPRYSLNREHLAYPAVDVLTGMRETLFSRIRETAQRWKSPPDFVGVFGSVARGDADLDSDVDILVVGKVGDAEVSALSDAVERWTGSPASVMVLLPDEIKEARRRGEPIIAEWERDLIPLIGSLADAEGSG